MKDSDSNEDGYGEDYGDNIKSRRKVFHSKYSEVLYI